MDILVQVKTAMDKFEEAVKAMTKMPKDELMKAIEESNKLCTCPSCPTYNNCAKTGKELLFCASGKSFMCISENKGCICPACSSQRCRNSAGPPPGRSHCGPRNTRWLCTCTTEP